VQEDWGRGRTLFLLLALLVSTWSLGQWRASEVDPETGQTAILDEHSVWHLRRISLALGTTRLGQSDSFLSFPHGADVVELPVFDHSVALGLRLLSGGRVAAGNGGINERLMTRALLFLGPLLAALLCLGMFLWLRAVVGATRRGAFFGAFACSLLPFALSAGEPGILAVESLAVLLLLLGTRLLAGVLRTQASLDRFTLAMLSGAVFGVGLATSPLFLIATFGAWAGLLFVTLTSHAKQRGDWIRSVLLFGACTSLGALLPSLGGPWIPALDGLVRGWTRLCVLLGLLSGVPYLLLLWLPNWNSKVDLRRPLLGSLILIAVLGLSLARAFGADHVQLGLLFASLDLDQGLKVTGGLTADRVGLLLLGAFALGEVWRVRGRNWTPLGVMLATWGAGALLAGWVHAPAALFFLPVAAVSLQGIFQGPLRLSRVAPLLVCLTVLAGWDSLDRHDHPDTEALQTMALCRKLRGESPGTGAWNTIHPVQRAGVLADGRLAPLMAWYGRVPCASLGRARLGDIAGRATLADLLLAEDRFVLVDHALGLKLRWVLWGSGSSGRVSAGPALLEWLDVESSSESEGWAVLRAVEGPD
jgi:hypothetical protein